MLGGFMFLKGLFEKVIGNDNHIERECFTDDQCRMLLIAKARWLLLFFLGAFSMFAAGLFTFSSYGFFLTVTQILAITIVAFIIILFNLYCSFVPEKVVHCHSFKYIQVFFDLAVVTLLIHFSGGAASWFWPVYLLVTLEAALLFEKTWEVWLLGAIGGLLYGGLLTSENMDWISNLSMPFVTEGLHHDYLYLVLIWCWVSLLNATISVIGAFLMRVIRGENQAMRESREQLSNFLEEANDLIFCVDPEGNIIYANQTWYKALQYKEGDRINILTLLDEECKTKNVASFRKSLGGNKSNPVSGGLIVKDSIKRISFEGNLTCNFKDGEPDVIWGLCRDVTEKKAVEAQLYHMAHHDTLTSLPNRMHFIDRLKQSMSLAKRLNHQVAVLFLDLDRFKIINDTLGHDVGDKLLQATSDRLNESVRESDAVGRHGGDEFTITLVNLHSREDAEIAAKKILKRLAHPVMVDGHELFITTSIGIALFPEDAETAPDMIKKADIAMYDAKSSGRNNVKFYDRAMDLDIDKRLQLESGMRKAVENNEFRVYYQPKVDIVTGNVTALEALLRWEHPELGLLPPAEFISLAEETGLIFPIGEWVMEESCRQNVEWQRQGLPQLRVAVNLSGYQLQQGELIDTVRAVLDRTGMDPVYLEFEVTETVIMQNPDFAVKILSELRDIGVHISIDDFGTGYSSLARLKRFSINTLKIDKSFVRDVEINSTDAAIATAIIAMGNSLDLKVIAEGVETEGQLAFLKDKRCDEIQGYLFSKPIPPAGIPELLKDQRLTVGKNEDKAD